MFDGSYGKVAVAKVIVGEEEECERRMLGALG